MKRKIGIAAVLGALALTAALYLAAAPGTGLPERVVRLTADRSAQLSRGAYEYRGEAGVAGGKAQGAAKSGAAYREFNAKGDADYGIAPAGQLDALKMPSISDRIIKAGALELQVKKGAFGDSMERAVAIVAGAGGFVSQSESRAFGESVASGELVIRVPAGQFDGVLMKLRRLGTVRSLDVTSEDVSEEYVDLESRLRHWRAQEAVMLGLMKKAGTIAESITVQNNLAQVQLEIERITGRLNFLKNHTSYATITLLIAEPQVVVRPDRLGLVAAAKDAVRAGASVVATLIVLLGYVLPLALLGALGYGAYRIIWNTRGARRLPEAGV